MNGSPAETKPKAVPWPAHEEPSRNGLANYGLFAALIALFLWSYHGSEIRLGDLFSREGGAQILAYVKGLFPPDFSANVIREAVRGTFETFAISFMGTLMAATIAFAIVFFASRNLIYSGLLHELEPKHGWSRSLRMVPYLLAKGLLNFLRTVPEMLWALIFVFIVGLGPFAGVLALGVHTGGVLGKLFGEVLEDVNQEPIESLQSTGANRLQILFYGILPQVLPQFISYTLYRWEVNIRVAAVLGFVGAGGLGQRIYIAISLFLGNQLLTYLIFIYALVTVADYLSAYLRRKAL
jgi:phosphonate transport system permease protein